ncbi:hypothetical protein AB1286_07800 [Trinickia sp. NRRL B-1857]|uniref:hypothetical protein n=1 Tax=Trinickia sp. NRRL B-1857 TaxID=3162879 RepID=UPI003D2C8C3A
MEHKTAESKMSASEQMMDATARFIAKLDTVPGWRASRISNLVAAMAYDEPFSSSAEKGRPIELPPQIDLQHAVVSRYMELADVVLSVKSCEFYFRRFPFNGLPVTRHEHLSNICELYFSRIYQFKERLKHLVDAVDALVPKHGIQFGPFIKRFAKEFDQEIRERHRIHHFQRFADLDIERVYLTGMHEMVYPDKGWKEEQQRYYRKVAKEWAQRVQERSARLDAFLDAVAEALLKGCAFLINGRLVTESQAEFSRKLHG